jgi:hypothetical protein
MRGKVLIPLLLLTPPPIPARKDKFARRPEGLMTELKRCGYAFNGFHDANSDRTSVSR